MDSMATSPQQQSIDISKMPDKDRQELQQFVSNEAQKATVQQDTCWKKCVTSRISSGKMDRGEESCVANCVDRFFDANMTVLKHLEALRGEGGGGI
ncbi:MAG: Mitochondrial import inner membrane translocase subunit tim8 [Candelina submexicana]|nr:MAG: Mitochondrial import inner membrane translocase subunit tim8 [Candelina submexicana]